MKKKILRLDYIAYILCVLSVVQFFFKIEIVTTLFNIFNVAYDVLFSIFAILSFAGLSAIHSFLKGNDNYSVSRTESEKEDKIFKTLDLFNSSILLVFSLLLMNLFTAALVFIILAIELRYEFIKKDVEIKLAINSLSEGAGQ